MVFDTPTRTRLLGSIEANRWCCCVARDFLFLNPAD